MWLGRNCRRAWQPAPKPSISILTNKYYIDEIYDAIIVLPLLVTSREFLWKFVDTLMIDGTVNGVGQLIRSSANGLRHMQIGICSNLCRMDTCRRCTRDRVVFEMM